MEKSPLTLVVVPIPCCPFTATFTPGRGISKSSTTVPQNVTLLEDDFTPPRWVFT